MIDHFTQISYGTTTDDMFTEYCWRFRMKMPFFLTCNLPSATKQYKFIICQKITHTQLRKRGENTYKSIFSNRKQKISNQLRLRQSSQLGYETNKHFSLKLSIFTTGSPCFYYWINFTSKIYVTILATRFLNMK